MRCRLCGRECCDHQQGRTLLPDTYEKLLVLYAFLEPIVNDKKQFSRCVRKRINELNMTTQELADRVGVAYQTVQNWLQKDAFPSKDPKILRDLLSGLEIEVERYKGFFVSSPLPIRELYISPITEQRMKRAGPPSQS